VAAAVVGTRAWVLGRKGVSFPAKVAAAGTGMWGFFRGEPDSSGMQGNLPPEAQEKIEELQDLQETAQQVAQQKQQAETQLQESKTAMETLDDVEGETQMYREVGELLIETDYDDAYEDVEERVDSLEVRVQTLEKQESRVQEQFEDLQEELQQMLQGAGGGPMGGAPGGPGAGGD
jgi:prefoldin beta subunit